MAEDPTPDDRPYPELDDAHSAVRALLNDLLHLVENLDPGEWPSLAARVLEYHEPAVPDHLLSANAVHLQEWCRAALDAMTERDEDAVRMAALKVRQYQPAVVTGPVPD